MIITNLNGVPGRTIERTIGLAFGLASVTGEKKEGVILDDEGKEWPWADTPKHYETLFRLAEERLASSGAKLGGDAVINADGKLSRSDTGWPEVMLIGTAVKLEEEDEGGVSVNMDGEGMEWEPPSATPEIEKLKKLKGRGRSSDTGDIDNKDRILQMGADIGVGRERMELLFHAGFRTLQDLSTASTREITSVEGINPTQARLIRKMAKEMISEEE
ncbi:MAG: helix-hairpin-helix domain-containing protein [Thermoplasmatota archaeon]